MTNPPKSLPECSQRMREALAILTKADLTPEQRQALADLTGATCTPVTTSKHYGNGG